MYTCSIGSLGQNGEHSAVEEIQVSNCSFRGTQNGMRIKTWEVRNSFNLTLNLLVM